MNQPCRPCAVLLVVVTVVALAANAVAAPKADLWPRWQAHAEANARHIDHRGWQRFLDTYLVTDHPSGINRIRYAAVTDADRQALAQYIDSLQGVLVSALNRTEQKAYWINLYNALTVKVILDHYPVASIREIDISPGWFADGPWDKKIATVEGIELSLNDIEHRILRPIFVDSRIHYAVNCASLGCPNLQPEAFTSANIEELLEQGARQYINHPRGAAFEGETLAISSIYHWFEEDFGGSEEGVLAHLGRYAEGELADRLKGFSGDIDHQYDWSLNDVGAELAAP